MRFRERHNGDMFIGPREVLAGIRELFNDIFGTDQCHHTSGYEPLRGPPEKLLLNSTATITEVEGGIQPDEGEAIRAGTAAEEIGRCQYVGTGQYRTNSVTAAFI